ncbi:hypothetical protein HHK36_032561 [Tetracentron sinense]|uniref:Uncharacterized protein n=1 Tax=Tetracentron sinense TaxID=13715 RepID=A0A834Y8Z8_TETSI|nr:hypothetical protein HHK36_032561 [Tetracentron sinense]
MSIGLPFLECVYCFPCARCVWKRFLHTAGHESETWGLATTEEFEPIPRLCRLILAVYEADLRYPLWAPSGGYGINLDWIILRKTYKDTHGRAPPYILYLDHEHADIVLAIRGFNLAKESDYAVLLDNKLGQRKFDGGYVHNGLLKAAGWVLDAECDVLRELVEKNPTYTLTFAGHSLGSGVVTLLAMVVVQNRDRLGNIDRKRIRCYAIAPARCMSLNLAVRYADVINSVVLQMKFPDTRDKQLITQQCKLYWISHGNDEGWDLSNQNLALPLLLAHKMISYLGQTPPGKTFSNHFSDVDKAGLPSFGQCAMFTMPKVHERCVHTGGENAQDPRRLYAPGRLYHIVERKPFRMGRFPPVVKTAVPVDGRFERVVLSCNATSDHSIIWIEKEAQRALDLMLEKDRIMEIPVKQKMERWENLTKEHTEEYWEALQRAVTLAVPHAFSPSPYGTFKDQEEEENPNISSEEASPESSKKSRKRESWDELIERLFDKDDSGHMLLKKSQSNDL